MLAINAMHGVFVLLLASYLTETVADVRKCYVGGDDFDESMPGKGMLEPISAPCNWYCMNFTRGIYYTCYNKRFPF